MAKLTKHNPGSYEARAAGCTCPIYDNAHGEGVPDGKGGRVFWFTSGCPYHNPMPGYGRAYTDAPAALQEHNDDPR